jgi:hypothetical protein
VDDETDPTRDELHSHSGVLTDTVSVSIISIAQSAVGMRTGSSKCQIL